MRWIILLLAAAGAASLLRKCRSIACMQPSPGGGGLKTNVPQTKEPAVADSPLSTTVDDTIPEALNNVLKELNELSDPLDRHAFFIKTVDKAYKDRAEQSGAHILASIAERHIKEFSEIKSKLPKKGNGARVPTFQKYATFLTETHQYDRAIAVCQEAIDHHLDDGTKGGFKERIRRISKQQDGVKDS